MSVSASSPSSWPQAAVLQMCSRADVATNLAGVTRLVRQAADAGAELAVLPECFALLGPEEAKVQVAEPLPAGGPILQHCRQLAATCGLELILGGFWEQGPEPGRVYNSCVHVRRDGAIGAVYRKMHLFDVDLADGTRLTESDTVAAGRAVQVTDTVVGRMGLSICYDLRFPELFRRQVEAGAKLIVVPAAFTLTTGKDHWHVLLRARAIENQCYVLAAAQWGQHAPGRVSYGHALIVDPWGIVRAECGEGEGLALSPIDLGYVAQVRASLPSLRHRRCTSDVPVSACR